MSWQEPPFAVQMEPTEGCQLRCDFCGLNSIRGPVSEGLNLKFMEVSTAVSVAEQMKKLGWNSRIELALHGEPSLNPRLKELVYNVVDVLPNVYMLMESNGAGFVGDPTERILALLMSGLDTLALDEYHNVNLVPRIREDVLRNIARFDQSYVSLHHYPSSGPKGNPHQRNSGRRLIFVAPIDTSTTGTHSTLSNHAGGGAPKNDKASGKRCAKPFREISIRYDGNVAICCNNWRGTYKCGNVLTDGLEAIWNGPAFRAARKKLYHGERDFGPCDGCDATSYRTGLLPDKMGKTSLPRADVDDYLAIQKALSGPSYAEPVLRPWEMVTIK